MDRSGQEGVMGWVAWLKGQLGADALATRLLVGVSWTTIGNLVSSAATLAGVIVLARNFGPAKFGQFGVVQNTLGYLGVLVGPSLGLTATRYVAQLRSTDPERLGRILRLVNRVTYLLSCLAASIIFLGAVSISDHLFRAPGMAPGFRAGAFVLLFTAVNGVQVGALCGFEAFRAIAIVNIVRGAITLPLLWACGKVWGPVGAIWGLAGSWGGACFVSGLYFRRFIKEYRVPLGAKGSWREACILLDFSIPGWIGGVVAGVGNWIGIVIVARQSDGMAQTGLISAANQLFLLLMFLPQIINQSALPILSERQGAKDEVGARTVFWGLVKMNLLATVPVGLAFSLASPLVMGRFGAGFVQGWPVLVLSVLAVPIYAVAMAGINQITAYGRMWVSMAIYFSYLIVFVGVSLLMSQHGAMGFATARILSFVTFGSFALLVVIRHQSSTSFQEA